MKVVVWRRVFTLKPQKGPIFHKTCTFPPICVSTFSSAICCHETQVHLKSLRLGMLQLSQVYLSLPSLEGTSHSLTKTRAPQLCRSWPATVRALEVQVESWTEWPSLRPARATSFGPRPRCWRPSRHSLPRARKREPGKGCQILDSRIRS